MSSQLFDRLQATETDPIFAIAQRARAAGASAIDASVGVISTDTGPLLFPSVRSAVQEYGMRFSAQDAGYPPLLGLPHFRKEVTSLLFGEELPFIASVATTGGTGALALQARLARAMDRDITAILPVPTWVNHEPLCRAAGLPVRLVQYTVDGAPSLEGIREGLRMVPGSTILVLQSGCHNPTGLDYGPDSWREIAALCTQHETVVLLDCAYQGLGTSVEEDVLPIRLLAAAGVPLLIAWSGAKNHTLYGLRPGLACAVTKNEESKRRIEEHYTTLIRPLHSAAATPAQHIVAWIQEHHRDVWMRELEEVRSSLVQKRQLMQGALPQVHKELAGNGLFCRLPLSPEAQQSLEREQQIFLAPEGRVNLSGVPMHRFSEFLEKVQPFLP